jgi:hypothetical protein
VETPPRLLERPHPVEARIGAEGLALLRARHAELSARIAQRIADPVRQEELKAQADRLNPDTWVTDTEAQEGLANYEAELAAMRAIIGHRRTRRRRGKGGKAEAAISPPGAAEAGPPGSPEAENS